MSVGFSPIVRRRRLGAEIRMLREREKLTLTQLGGLVGWSAAKLSRLENARIRPDVGDVMDVLDALGVTGTRRDQLIGLARDAANSRGWWNAYGGDLFDRQQPYAEFENGAVQIREFQLTHVPGLLQTRAYAAARFASRPSIGLPPVDVDAAAEARIARQVVLTRDPPLSYQALLDESALVRRCGSEGVRGEQFAHLAEMAELPTVTLRILPYQSQIGDGYLPRCSFSLYRFADPVDPEIAMLETETSDIHIGDDEGVNRYKLVFEQMWAAAFSVERTIKLLTEARDNLDEEFQA
ncbi:MAG TPA: helix-turn-helix transcriptional regulator [Mycobacteriales bacterium]|nr:helix-turn-helix transcriptional regulator [Mycobacteriales bacterium]